METKIFQEVPAADREATLQANAYDSEEKLIKKHFSEEEINDMRRTFTKNSIEIRKKMEEFRRMKAEIDAFIKPLNEENTYMLSNIRAGYVEVNQQVYLFEDHDNSMMLYYDAQGILVESRRMLPSEKQSKIKTHNQPVG